MLIIVPCVCAHMQSCSVYPPMNIYSGVDSLPTGTDRWSSLFQFALSALSVCWVCYHEAVILVLKQSVCVWSLCLFYF